MYIYHELVVVFGIFTTGSNKVVMTYFKVNIKQK